MNNEHLIKTCSYAIDESVFFKNVCSNKISQSEETQCLEVNLVTVELGELATVNLKIVLTV
jgi:hypothetical protein